MTQTITIHEAKTHLSKYIRQAKAGQPVYIGSYGQQEVLLAAAPVHKKRKLGIWADRPIGYKDEDIVGPDPDIIAEFEQSVNRPLPGYEDGHTA